jgi:hypothetical protein
MPWLVGRRRTFRNGNPSNALFHIHQDVMEGGKKEEQVRMAVYDSKDDGHAAPQHTTTILKKPGEHKASWDFGSTGKRGVSSLHSPRTACCYYWIRNMPTCTTMVVHVVPSSMKFRILFHPMSCFFRPIHLRRRPARKHGRYLLPNKYLWNVSSRPYCTPHNMSTEKNLSSQL